MVKIRLSRRGAKKRPYYRIVIADSRSKRDGKTIEVVGSYDPVKKDNQVSIKEDRIKYWHSQGAQPTNTVRSIISRQGIKLS